LSSVYGKVIIKGTSLNSCDDGPSDTDAEGKPPSKTWSDCVKENANKVLGLMCGDTQVIEK